VALAQHGKTLGGHGLLQRHSTVANRAAAGELAGSVSRRVAARAASTRGAKQGGGGAQARVGR
jgi:hypothetical protein